MKSILEYTIRQYQEVQKGRPWIGSTYERKWNHIDKDSAFIRPLENLHSVAEIISHLTLWRKETILKINTGKGSKTDDCEENWLTNDKLRPIGWDTIKSEYENSLEEVITLLEGKDDSFLSEKYYDTDFKGYFEYSFVINGMLHHDLYHLGQIGLVIKFLREKDLI